MVQDTCGDRGSHQRNCSRAKEVVDFVNVGGGVTLQRVGGIGRPLDGTIWGVRAEDAHCRPQLVRKSRTCSHPIGGYEGSG